MQTKRVPLIVVFFAAAALTATGQKNNPYSTNPETAKIEPRVEQGKTIAQSTYKIAADAVNRTAKPTELYKLGVGDVLQISLANAPTGNGYYTIRQDGTIDFPLAGDKPLVEGMTLDEAEDSLSGKVTLYRDARVFIKVREYASHKVTVTGMAAFKGERALCREAMPLFTIRADAGVDPAATKVLVRRSELAKPEVYRLSDDATGDVLIYPGNTIEFATDALPATSAAFFYIAGGVQSPGQKEFHAGMTLMQAVMAAGGATRDVKAGAIRRKTESGTLRLAEYNLRKIRDGKLADPVLESGDMVEIGN